MKHLARVKLTPEQHRQLVVICDSPVTFPSTYDAWQEIVRKGEAEALQCGEPVDAMAIEIEDFVTWCGMVGIFPCLDALKAYAIVQRLAPADSVVRREH
ncbi:MAG: hypothetical protein ABW190_08510, partial [Rhizobacter sp.]